MALTDEFTIPEFLNDQSTDEIHGEMLDALPEDIDKSQGQFPWDMTRPTALEISYFAEYVMVEALKQIFPMYSYGDFLDCHGYSRNIYRKAATYAIGYVTVTGTEGTIIPSGTIFSTESENDVESIDFETMVATAIPSSETIDIPIRCSTAGRVGNVAPNTIILNSSGIEGLTNITNADYTHGGTDEEDDDNLRERIVQSDRGSGNSFTGCDSDYKRWALEVDGTGSANVIPAKDNSGLVTIVLLDANNDPASEDLCTEVYNHIMSPNDRSKRLTGINDVYLNVIPPQTLSIAIAATIEIPTTTTTEAVTEAFFDKVKDYLITAAVDGEVKISKVGSILSETDGILDYSSLTVNGGTSNIAVGDAKLPVITIENIVFTEGTV